MPVLANVHLSAEGNLLHIAATDLYLSMSGAIEAEVKRAGSIAVAARDVFERVRHMPDGPIEITVSGGAATTLKAVGSARRYTLHGVPGADFPALPIPADEAVEIALSVETLRSLIDHTLFSISSDETRAHLNSALFECGDGVVRMVSTDGHRLSKVEIPVEGLGATTTMLIPRKAITELKKLLDEITDHRNTTMVVISQNGPTAFFKISGVQFSVKLIDAQFPPYDQVIPAMTDRAVRTPRLQLTEALEAVSLAASDRTGGVKLSITESSLKITSESPESGNGFDEVPVDYHGPEISVGFNARYLLDVLKAITDEEITLGLSGELDPAVVKPTSNSGRSANAAEGRVDYVAVVMPMRI